MALDGKALHKIVAELVNKPGHEKVRALNHTLLTQGLSVESRDINFEERIKEVNGRADAITGESIFEFKRDLSSEKGDAEAQLKRYAYAKKKDSPNSSYIGLSTDGADYYAYAFEEDGVPILAEEYKVNVEDPEGLLDFLRRIVVFERNLRPDFDSIKQEFGKNSIVWKQAEISLQKLWAEVRETPDAKLKYQLWCELLSLAYGATIDDESLFLRHTYMSVLAKSIAWAALLDEMPKTAQEIVTGEAFTKHNITGMGGEDFFGWIGNTSGGDDFVKKLTAQAGRFKLYEADTDVMKGLYESLIDPEERHSLGEYYTPDWLAERICKQAIASTPDTLQKYILDPSCGSGTFLFHAVRRLIEVAQEQEQDPVIALERILARVRGMDIHPVAVTVAQVTFLLAILPTIKTSPLRTMLSIPVYLGDALQWWVDRPSQDVPQGDLLTSEKGGGLKINVPKMQIGTQKLGPVSLVFPMAMMANHDLFDETITAMLELSADNAPTEDFRAWMARNKSIVAFDYDPLASTYKELKKLQNQGRNHVWGFVARNLARPIWLSETNKSDILIGNPPWVAYNRMRGGFKTRFKQECEKSGLWVGAEVTSSQDLSAYFFMRAARLYLKPEGKLALIMPDAALSRKAYEKFRAGTLWDNRKTGGAVGFVQITEAWSLGADCKPLFPVPACVIFADRKAADDQTPLTRPDKVHKISGTLPRRDAQPDEADESLTSTITDWPTTKTDNKSPYFRDFSNGASLQPRRLILTTHPPQRGRLPANQATPFLIGKTGNLDKPPWKDINPPEGQIEAQFLKPVLYGSSIAPYRLLAPETGIIPILEQGGNDKVAYEAILLDGKAAQKNGFIHLAKWLKQAEELWEANKAKTAKETLTEWWNFRNQLTAQFPNLALRVVYTASGTYPAAIIVTNPQTIIQSALYWAEVENMNEGRYLTAIFNSQTAKNAVAPMQSQGQFGARHFHKYILFPNWPRFDENSTLHQDIVAAAEHAETIAQKVEVPEKLEGMQFTRIRSKIRTALKEDGIAETINELTARLLA